MEVLVKGNAKEDKQLVMDGFSIEEKILENQDLCCTSPHIINEGGCETCKNCGSSKCIIA